MTSCVLFVIRRREKISKVDCYQNIHHQVFWSHFANHEFLLQSGA